MASGNRVLRVDHKGVLRVLAGTGAKGFTGDGGPATAATFNGIHNFVVLANGDLLLADAFNHAIRKIESKSGIVTTIAGDGKKGFRGDGRPAASAQFDTPIQIALDPGQKLLLVADIGNKRVRRIDLATMIMTVAGNGRAGIPADGAHAPESSLVDPRAVAVATDGSFYILERSGHALRYVDVAGRIRTVAGTGKPGLSGDDGPALAATMNGPKYITLDRDSSVLIADTENHVIRRYNPGDGRITRVAGTGKRGNAGLGGDPLACELDRPHGVTVGPDGTLYVTDSYNDRILKIVR
jgi:DNA-binding beta-propeller fold protein YncE